MSSTWTTCADRGTMDIVYDQDFVIVGAAAPIVVVTDIGPCFRGAVFAAAFTSGDPLLRHVRTRGRSPQTNGVVERFFGSLEHEHLYRAIMATVTPSPSRPTAFARPITLCDRTKLSATGRRGRRTSPAWGVGR